MKTITAPPISLDHAPLHTMRGLPKSARVDRDRRTIFGVSIMQLGSLNEPDARPWFADATTLSQLLALGKASPKGVKSRLNHPNMSTDGMGRQLGRFRAWRMSEDGSQVLADEHLASFAFRGGEKSIGAMVLDMAEEDPEIFGVSIAPVFDLEEMERNKRDDGMMPMRIKRLLAVDVVDEPAATRGGLFGDSPLSIGTAPHKATEALNTLFADAGEDVIRARVGSFLNSYLATRFGGQTNNEGDDDMSLTQEALDKTLENFGKTLSTTLLSQVDEKLAALKPKADPEPTPAEIEKRGAERLSQLCALAASAGLKEHEKIGKGWFDKNLSVADATEAIKPLMVAGNSLTKDAGQGEGDADAAYKAEYKAQLSSFVSMGLTEDEYITSRKIDDGKAILAAGLGVEKAA